MRLLAVTHGPAVQPELYADVAAAEGHTLTVWDIRSQGKPPAGFDAVLVFGGDQNVGEELEHPWLHEEYDALRGWVADEVPLFAVCLGAQTLAHALGGIVEPLPVHSAGFVETTLTDDGAADPVLGVLPRTFDALNANAYGFTVPDEATTLATAVFPQAFRVGRSAWAVQFHPEVRHDQVLEWFRDEPSPPRPLDELAAELDRKLPAWQELGRRLARAFLAAADGA
ncbi:MAG TPA: type 1 glutamine amidotransferase [Gaiellaceae bacterium]|nr:type 1 glutamine amidotransferase [Gaiellaceae bacterium]